MSNTWQDIYKSKLTTAEKAVQLIKSNNRVVSAHAVGEPKAISRAIVKNAAAYKNVEIFHLVTMGEQPFTNPEYKDNFRNNGFFLSAGTKAAVASGQGDFSPGFFHEIPKFLRTTLPPDVLIVQVSPPDEHGYCSTGVSSDFTIPAARIAPVVLVQVNKFMPRTFGDTFIHVKDMTAIVECDEPLAELPQGVLSETEIKIGKNVASLVKDGDCLQLGIGGIPDAVLASLTDKNDLGLHTEMFADGTVNMLLAGNINNKRKNFHPGKSVATFLMGTRKLYDYVDNNPTLELLPVDYVNHPAIACKNDNLVAINSCVQVDMMGQVVSDSIGLKQLSGVGGQVDFVRAAAMSNGGRSVMAMASTTKGISKIVPLIDEGAAVTTSRFDVDYVVTEIGVAALKGKTLKERARALINITHPDHRAALIAAYETRFSQKY